MSCIYNKAVSQLHFKSFLFLPGNSQGYFKRYLKRMEKLLPGLLCLPFFLYNRQKMDRMYFIDQLYYMPIIFQAKEQGKAEVEELLSKLEKVRYQARQINHHA